MGAAPERDAAEDGPALVPFGWDVGWDTRRACIKSSPL